MQKLAVIYYRVSDPKQLKFGRSFKDQPDMLRAFAKAEGYSVYKLFSDAAKTGTTVVGREGLEDALACLAQLRKEYPDAEIAFIVQDIDRIARDEIDYFAIKGVLRKYKIKVKSKNQTNINDDSPEGRFQEAIMAAMAALQSRITGRKVSDVKKCMIEEGLTTHKAPLGYRNINKGTEDNPRRGYVEFDPVDAPKVRSLIEDYATGNFSFIQLAQKYNAEGLRSKNGKPLQRSAVGQIIGNSYYAGMIKYNDKEYPGIHPKLIDPVLFERCKAMLAERNNYAVRKRKPENHAKFFMKGILQCGVCGYSVTADATRGRNGTKYDYYHCGRLLSDKKHHSVKGECISREDLETKIAKYFGLFVLSDDVVNEVMERAKEILAEMHGDKDVELRKIANDILKLETQRQNLEIAYLEGAYKGDDTFQDRNAQRIDTELGQCRKRTLEIESTRKDIAKLFVALVRLARDLPNAYLDAPPEVKKMYLTLFWDKFVLEKKEIVKAVPSEPVLALLNEKLITLNNKGSDNLFLIRRVWLPGSSGLIPLAIISLLSDTTYWRGVEHKLDHINTLRQESAILLPR